jgi:hypothetical protein
MNVILSEKQLKFLIENHDEFKEIYDIEDMEDIDDDFKLKLQNTDKSRRAIDELIRLGFRYHLLWENELNIDEFTDMAFKNDTFNVTLVYLYDNENNIVLKLKLGDYRDGFIVNYVEVNPKYKGRGLSLKTYLKFSEKIKKPLYSGLSQTQHSKFAIWENLYKNYPHRVMAYINGKKYPIYKVKDELMSNNKNVYDNPNKQKYTDTISDTIHLVLMPEQ